MKNNFQTISKYCAQKINTFVFIFCISVLGLSFLLLPKKNISINEKRNLTQFPEISVTSIINGNYMDSIDLYFADHFPWREQFIDVANSITNNRGFADEDLQYFTRNTEINNTSKIPENLEKEDSLSFDELVSDTSEKNNSLPFETIKSIIVSNQRAIQMFGASKYGAKNYAGLINKYKNEFGAAVNVYCMPVPVGADFYLPEKINKQREKEFIDDLFNQLQIEIIRVNAYEELSKHINEYIQFNTDHHWTGLGAYYAYVAFCESAGIEPLPLSSFKRKVIPNFLGSLYYYTLSKELKKNIDSVEYFKVPVKTKTFFIKNGNNTEQSCQLYAEYARGSNAYGVFLGGDYPLMRVSTSIKNARKILIFKDSFGNAFSPYLTSHFEEVFIIDYRYYDGDIKRIIDQNKITDIIFSHNVYVATSSFTVKKEMGMLNFIKQIKTSKQTNNKDTALAIKIEN